jgi:hypothetical protein
MPSTLRAGPSKNQLAFPNHSLTQRSRRRLRYFIPLYVLDIPAAVADEVVVPYALQIESAGTALSSDFTHQSHPH